MTDSAVVYTEVKDAPGAAQALSSQVAEQFGGAKPDAMVVFAAPGYDHELLLRNLVEASHPGVLVGASSAGEFTHSARGQDNACVLALRSDEMRFSAGLGRGLKADRAGVARAVTSTFQGIGNTSYGYRTALILTDALAGHAEDLVDELTLATSGTYQFVGGGAGDNAQFQRTAVFHMGSVVTDAAVGLEILSNKPVGIGVGHGWKPSGAPMRVTEAQGARLVSLNGFPALQAFQKHAQATGQSLDVAAPIPFFLHNILGVETGAGHRLRVPLAVNRDGSVDCAAEIPAGALVSIMRTTANSAAEAASQASQTAVKGLGGNRPQVALFFDCVATRLRLGDVFGLELQAVAAQLGKAAMMGCNTHGQIARADGQFGGFHNCTAVVCALPA